MRDMRDMDEVEAEVAVMGLLARQLPTLGPDARVRVIDWARNVAAPVHDPYERLATMAEAMAGLARAVRRHKANTKQPRQVDKELWEAFESIGISLPETGVDADGQPSEGRSRDG